MGNHFLLRLTSQRTEIFLGDGVILSDHILVQSRTSCSTPARLICSLQGVRNKNRFKQEHVSCMLFN